ncbi:RNA-binding domain-containing protein [Vibrio crassostreae]|uniref:RNA-binding domain-containing protein n=1 Tax=Vibrio crassostreae TaxID=246167 RepID=UPI0002D9244F|nr:RNA-binding domain-containing protein [Vibrio crassostreae]OEE88377.1 AAA family ATPase [Vibrio crassostreae 9ZC88]
MSITTINDILDLETLSESNQVEFKLAGGRDGKGALPKDFWSSYSAMANSRGGWVILGVQELNQEFIPVGVAEPEKVKIDLFNQLNDRDRVSANVISDDDVQIVQLKSKPVMAIHIPPATRNQKPVHLKKTPFGNTYMRIHDGDRKCDNETVKRMIAEQLHDSRDSEILSEHYSFIEDINIDSLKTYRNLLAAHSPQHPYLEYELFDLFKKIGGWIKNRENGKEGLTLAGVLMFGNWEAISAAAPNYFVDFQERPEAKTELRWVDRVCPDGTWSGNLFDFYRKVYGKLSSEIKVPFEVEAGQRKADTPVHIALREALVNSIVHSDFTDRVSILIVKRPDMFGFRNPGLMRIPLEDVIAGGVSDCRNRLLHQMFLLIGLGERAGSGMPKIFSGWKSVNWRTPKLWEKPTPPQTILELSTASLIPDATRAKLLQIFDYKFNALGDFEQLIVATAAIEGWINHERACQLTTKHSREVTLTLPKLETKGFLVSNGEQKQKSYTLPGVSLPTPDEVFAPSLELNALTLDSNSTQNYGSLTHNDDSLTHNETGLTHNTKKLPNEEKRDVQGRIISERFERPFVDDINKLEPSFKEHLEGIAKLAMENKRLAPEDMRNILISLCKDQYIPIGELAKLVNRTSQNIRQSHLKPMINEDLLKMAFPNTPNNPMQSYTVKN